MKIFVPPSSLSKDISEIFNSPFPPTSYNCRLSTRNIKIKSPEKTIFMSPLMKLVFRSNGG